MEKEKTNNLAESIQDTKNDIAKLLDFFSLELSKEEQENYSMLASLIKTRTELIETLSFMSNFDIELIESSLL